MRNIKFVIEQEEPYEGRLSRTVPWEREGEIPSRDPTVVEGIEWCSLKYYFGGHVRLRLPAGR
jgi:hypothetical protein